MFVGNLPTIRFFIHREQDTGFGIWSHGSRRIIFKHYTCNQVKKCFAITMQDERHLLSEVTHVMGNAFRFKTKFYVSWVLDEKFAPLFDIRVLEGKERNVVYER